MSLLHIPNSQNPIFVVHHHFHHPTISLLFHCSSSSGFLSDFIILKLFASKSMAENGIEQEHNTLKHLSQTSTPNTGFSDHKNIIQKNQWPNYKFKRGFFSLFLPVDPFKDLLQCKMALSIPSCCCNNESSLRFGGGATATTAAANPLAAEADLLLPRCLQTNRIPVGRPFSSFSLTGESTAADDNSPPVSVGFFRSLGFISFRYFCTASFENRHAGDGAGTPHETGGKMPLILLVLLSLVNFELRIRVSSCSGPAGALFLDIDLCFLKMKSVNLGADLRNWIGDWGFEVVSIGRIFRFEMESGQRFMCSPNLVGIWGLCSGLWILPAETEKSSRSKNESSSSSSSSSSSCSCFSSPSAPENLQNLR